MKEYKTEEEFLKDYDSSQFEKLSMTADILIVSVSSTNTDNYRADDTYKHFSVLLKQPQKKSDTGNQQRNTIYHYPPE